MQKFLKPLLILGVVLLLIVVVSWFAFPGWRAQPSGLVTLVGVAVVGLAALVKDGLDIAKTWRELQEPEQVDQASDPAFTQKQAMTKSPQGEQDMTSSGGDQSQEMQDSERGKQTMR